MAGRELPPQEVYAHRAAFLVRPLEFRLRRPDLRGVGHRDVDLLVVAPSGPDPDAARQAAGEILVAVRMGAAPALLELRRDAWFAVIRDGFEEAGQVAAADVAPVQSLDAVLEYWDAVPAAHLAERSPAELPLPDAVVPALSAALAQLAV